MSFDHRYSDNTTAPTVIFENRLSDCTANVVVIWRRVGTAFERAVDEAFERVERVVRKLRGSVDAFREELARHETVHERRRRLTREAIERSRLLPPLGLAERLWDRPRRVGRACGSAHRVMLC